MLIGTETTIPVYRSRFRTGTPLKCAVILMPVGADRSKGCPDRSKFRFVKDLSELCSPPYTKSPPKQCGKGLGMFITLSPPKVQPFVWWSLFLNPTMAKTDCGMETVNGIFIGHPNSH